jgi:hypothetical protein
MGQGNLPLLKGWGGPAGPGTQAKNQGGEAREKGDSGVSKAGGTAWEKSKEKSVQRGTKVCACCRQREGVLGQKQEW